jgi:cleavage stimulation factor subunit 3
VQHLFSICSLIIDNLNSFLLYLAHAEYLERDRKFKEAHEVFNSFLTTLAQDLENANVIIQTEEILAKALESVQGEVSQLKKSNEAMMNRHEDMYCQKQSYGVVYIAYLKFTLRSEGLNAFRSIFERAKKDKWIPWEVFEVAGICLLALSLF